MASSSSTTSTRENRLPSSSGAAGSSGEGVDSTPRAYHLLSEANASVALPDRHRWRTLIRGEDSLLAFVAVSSVEHLPVDAGPFELGRGSASVILLHGLTGTPFEVRPLADRIHAAGYAAHAPRLAGHTDLRALEDSTWRDWYGSAEAVLDDHRKRGRRVVVLGFSMGALLALRLAAKRPDDVAGVVAISVPLEQPRWQRHAIAGLASLRRKPLVGRWIRPRTKQRGPDIRIWREQARSPSLSAFPYPSLREFVALQREVRACLPRVRTPLLLIHGRLDHTAPVEHSARVAQAVSSPDVRRVILPRSFHIVGRDLDADRAADEVTRFVTKVLGPTESEPSL